MGGRRILVGDLQGCREELEDLLEAVRFDPAADAIHPVGDLVNRGPDSLGVLRLLKELGAGGVLGNHDMHLVRTARGERRASPRDRMEAVLAADDRDELLAWLLERPVVRAWMCAPRRRSQWRLRLSRSRRSRRRPGGRYSAPTIPPKRGICHPPPGPGTRADNR